MVLSAGITCRLRPLIVESNGLTLNSFASYNLGKVSMLVGYANRQMQQFAGTELRSAISGAPP